MYRYSIFALGDIVAGAVGAAVSGAALGAGTALVSTLLPVTGVASFTAMVGVGAGSAGLGNVVEQLLDTKKGIDVGSLLEASVISGITGNIPFKLNGYLGKGFSGEFLLNNLLFCEFFFLLPIALGTLYTFLYMLFKNKLYRFAIFQCSIYKF